MRRRPDPAQIAFIFVFAPCAKCGAAVIGRKHRYCRSCHAAYMRGWRPNHPLSEEQRHKDNARSYAGVYKRRGKLTPQPCICGSTDVEMHHPDYDKPLGIIWLCRPCHLELHTECFPCDKFHVTHEENRPSV